MSHLPPSTSQCKYLNTPLTQHNLIELDLGTPALLILGMLPELCCVLISNKRFVYYLRQRILDKQLTGGQENGNYTGLIEW